MTCVSVCLLLVNCGSPRQTAQTAAPVQAHMAPERATTADNRPAIIAFGDSLSAGFGADAGQSFPDFLQKDLDRAGLRYRVINAGVSGDTTTDGLERLNDVVQLKAAIVILELGGNDGLRGLPVESTRVNLERMVVGLRKSGAQVVLAGMTLPRNYGADYIHSFERIYAGLAKKYKLVSIPFLLEGVGGVTRYMQADGIHPTAEGNERVAATVFRYLKPILK
ncbi:MAG: arylesterase [Acidobacteriota bacterium]|nr:arylesterase [Acidobacteriota bacterium]